MTRKQLKLKLRVENRLEELEIKRTQTSRCDKTFIKLTL